jgi:hypothetical protein
MRPARTSSWLRATSTGAALLGTLLLFGCAEQGTSPTSPDGDLSAAFGQAGPPQELGPAFAAQGAHSERLMAMRDVVGTGVGINEEGEPAVAVYLTRPGASGVPDELDGVPVERIVTGLIVADSDPTSRARPAPVGYSIGHPDITAGTFGARVTDGSGVFLLSNNHVMANSNDAEIGDPIYQPGPYDGGDADDEIAQLSDFEEIVFDGSVNYMDAAVATTHRDSADFATPSDDGYGAPSSTVYDLDGDGDPGTISGVSSDLVDLAVTKYGRTTELTQGTIAEVNVNVTVCSEPPFPFGCNASAYFEDQISIEPGSFSDGGDSGSLIVTDDGSYHPVSLLFAGSDTRTIGNRIDRVLNRFGVDVDDGSDESGETTDDPPTVSITNPSDGETVSGSVNITADASDDGSVSQVEFLVDNSSIGTDSDGSDGWSTSWNTEDYEDGGHTVTAEATDDAGQPSSAEIMVTVDNTTDDGGENASGMHVGDLDGTSVNQGRTWDAVVTVTVHDANGDFVADATVSGAWSGTGQGSVRASICTTDATGQCDVRVDGMRKNNGTVTYTVDDITHDTLTYSESDNHDPDGDSDGTTITVSK